MAPNIHKGGETQQPNGDVSKRPNSAAKKSAPRSRAVAPASTRTSQRAAKPISNKAASIAGESPVNGVTSAYAIMASRIANRVAEMAESITFVERSKPQAVFQDDEKRRPRKLEMRLPGSDDAQQVAFSAPFLDNTLQKMLQLQNRMLKSTAELSRGGSPGEKAIKEQAAQSAELSRIIAMICAEKARQGA